jgi:outer membrane protein
MACANNRRNYTFNAERCLFAQSPPVASNRPWHSIEENQIVNEARRFPGETLHNEPDKTYSLAELIDLAEAYNPATRVAWESARAQAAALGIARSELFRRCLP